MKQYELPIGRNGGKVQFEITEDNQLNLKIKEKGEEYRLTLLDCIFMNKIPFIRVYLSTMKGLILCLKNYLEN